MSELLAGLSSGFLLGVITVGLGALLIIPSKRSSHAVQKSADEIRPVPARWSVGLPILVVLISGFFLGPLFGITLLIFKRALPAGGLGSPNLMYTLSVLLLAVVATGVTLFVQNRNRLTEKLLLATVFSAVFGWLLPILGS